MNAEEKERLVEEFRACLEECADEEQGAAAVIDLATLLAEMAALRNEVRIESRQFKSAFDDLRSMADLLREQNERLNRDLERSREAAATAVRQAERRLLLDMLDVRDRLDAGITIFRAWQPSWMSRFSPADALLAKGLGEGVELTLRRLDELLDEKRVRPVAANGGVGASLDPNRMRAVAVEHRPDRPAGEVLREVRRGYMREAELLRYSEVIVNKGEGKA